MTLNQLLNWLAFGTDQDVIGRVEQAFESQWGCRPIWTGERVASPALSLLQRLERGEPAPDPSYEPNFARLHNTLLAKMDAEETSVADLRETAEGLKNGLEALLLTLEAAKSALAGALAAGRLAARGVPTAGAWEPSLLPTAVVIPAEFFGTPGVILGLDSTLSVGHQQRYGSTYFLTQEVKETWDPLPIAALPTAAAALASTTSARAGIGGPTPKYDWKDFAREMIRVAALEADGNLTVRAFREMMRAWAAENMIGKDGNAPDNRTVEREFKALLPPGAFPD